MNPLQQLRAAGQSIWLDFLRRGLITGGALERWIGEDGVGGVTSNPSIFGKAIAGSSDYDDALRAIAEKGPREPIDVFYDLALQDIQMAADVFRPLYDATGGGDGYVSFELEPKLAHDSAGSIAKAKQLFEELAKPNVMIKVPGTEEGVAAVEELTAAGVNVNITLLFSVSRYEQVALAYLRGLERRLDAGEPVDGLASVASFLVSRVDTAVDALLPADSPLRGKVAIANAKIAYRRFRDIFSGERWGRLAAAGARLQRPLWASTGTKNPAYSDVVYIEELIGPDTVNTMPQATLDAFRDHGIVRPVAVDEGIEKAELVIASLPEAGIGLSTITAGLVESGIEAFEADLAKLLSVIEEKTRTRLTSPARADLLIGDDMRDVAATTGKRHDKMSVPTLLEAEQAGWEELEGLVEQLTPEQGLIPGYHPGWSVKDLLAHLAGWLAEAGMALEQDPSEILTEGTVDVDARNEAFVDANRDQPLSIVLAELYAARRRVLQHLHGLTGGVPAAAEASVRKAGPEHYAEHLPRLQEWIAELRSDPSGTE